ncbi:MAG: hypothetical protein H0T42_30855 [Deltaproteobacteria bacterium]|nr:hypothetical protein [Deltaproteobacteria bacterium]
MDPAFVTARKDGQWRVATRSLTGSCAGIEVTGERRWWGGRWSLTSAAPFPVPEKLILFVSASGMEHGFWRDLIVGDRSFDHQFFIFCDTPALLPLVLGPATRRVLRDHGQSRDALTLYVRAGVTRVLGTCAEDDPLAFDRHIAVHQALGEDHRACLADWQQLMTASHGRADESWPPVATIMSRTGTLTVHASWTAPTTRDGADWERSADSLRTHLQGHDGRKRRRWTLHEMEPGVAGTHTLGGRHITILGEPSISLPLLDDLVHMGDIVSISCGSHVAIALRGLAGPRQMNAALRIIELIVDPAGTGSPYR